MDPSVDNQAPPQFTPDITELETAYLSRKGLQKVADIFRKIGAGDSLPSDSDVRAVRSSIRNEKWEDYDSVYATLYSISLLREKQRSISKDLRLNIFDTTVELFSTRKPGSDVVRVDYLIDMELSGSNKFKLIDEFSVRSLMSFRNFFSDIVSYDNAVTHLDFGCLSISFGVLVPHVEGLSRFYKSSEMSSVAEEILKRKLSQSCWVDIKNRFYVKDEQISVFSL